MVMETVLEQQRADPKDTEKTLPEQKSLEAGIEFVLENIILHSSIIKALLNRTDRESTERSAKLYNPSNLMHIKLASDGYVPWKVVRVAAVDKEQLNRLAKTGIQWTVSDYFIAGVQQSCCQIIWVRRMGV